MTGTPGAAAAEEGAGTPAVGAAGAVPVGAVPVGAVPVGASRWRFVVWAPQAGSVTVLLHDGRTVPLAPLAEAWPGAGTTPGFGGYHAATVDGVAHGDRYRVVLDGGEPLPDPASRWQPDGVHGPSACFDPGRHRWDDAGFVAPPLGDSVLYELHVGTFAADGTLDGVVDRLAHLVALGVTTVELMPLAQFPGARNWGYDGVLPYAVHDAYGGPCALQRLVDACHRSGLAVCLDVVYNHLGPEGNVLPRFGPYTTDRYSTPWGPAVNVDGPGSDEVRRYLVHNALQWFADFHVDMLRLDAVHGIVDTSPRPFLQELAEATAGLGCRLGRRLLLVAESADNDPRLVRGPADGGPGLDGQWSDDLHHALRTLLTGERLSYYRDFGQPAQLAEALAHGFVFRGQYSAALGRAHGSPAPAPLPERFVVYSQNHDQVGNRPRGDRLGTLVPPAAARLAPAVVCMAPGVPMLFMGEEYGETAPFPYFVDHGDPALVEAVRTGRAEEMGELFATEPLDPADPATFTAAKLDLAQATGAGADLFAHYRRWLHRRRHHPALAAGGTTAASSTGTVVTVVRRGPASAGAGAPPGAPAPAALALVANTGERAAGGAPPPLPDGAAWRLVESSASEAAADGALALGPWGYALYEAQSGAAAVA